MADVTTPFGFPYPEPTDLVRDGATDIEALAEAANDQFLAGFQFAGQRIYTSSGQFEKADPFGTGDIGLRAVRVTVVSGGGSGGGAAATTSGEAAGGGGGGGGASASAFVLASALASSVTVTRGAGGAAASAGGNTGGTSLFDGHASALGGFGGEASGALAATLAQIRRAGDGGAATAGDLQFVGGAGGAYFWLGQNVSNAGKAGDGGAASLGGGARRGDRIAAAGFVGLTGNFPGGGGTGAGNFFPNAAKTGGPGANGIIIVEVFV